MYMIQYGYHNSTASTIQLFMEQRDMISYVDNLLEGKQENFYVEIVKVGNHVSLLERNLYARVPFADDIHSMTM